MRIIDDADRLAVAASQNIKEKNYWLEKLSGSLEKIHFPYDREEEAREKNINKAGCKFTWDDGDLFSTLMEISRESAYTLNIILQAGLILLLNKYTSCKDIIIGAPIYKQDMGSDKKFINTVLALRILLRRNISFKELLLQVRQTVVEAAEHQDYPMQILIDDLNLSPSTGEDEKRSPLFDVAILLENIHDKRYIQHIQTNMLFSFLKLDNRIDGVVEYNPALYDNGTVERIISHYRVLLERALGKPDLRIFHIDILSEEEKHRLLFEFNSIDPRDSKDIKVPDITTHQWFEQQVEKTPDRIADSYRDSHLTYRKLNEDVNRLARILRRKGITSDTIVGVLLEHSLEMIIAVVAVLKAGGAFLPIDKETPLTRIISLLEDCQSSILLTKNKILDIRSFTALQGLRTARADVRLTAPRSQVSDFDALPWPDRSLVNYEIYSKYIGLTMFKNVMVLQASRGCPYNCAYCHKIWPKRHVTRSAANIFQEVLLYYRVGVRRFAFIDDIFNLDAANSAEFFKLVIQNGLNAQFFFPNGFRGDILTKEYIDLAVEAGTVNIALSLETASPRIQKMIRKNLDLEKLRENIQYICDTYPQVILELQLMHGFPTETEAEAKMTLEFLKSLRWIHFPYLHILKIFPTTDMAELAVKNGISSASIETSANLSFHELPETLPFDKNFTLKCQSEFFNDYFLSRERLLYLLPYQLKCLTEDELVQKYNSYLPIPVNCLADLLEFVGIAPEELNMNMEERCPDDFAAVPGLNNKLQACFSRPEPSPGALRVLLLDLSQYFSNENEMLYDVMEPPLGLMYLLTYLEQQFGHRVKGKIAKSRVDFDSYRQLKTLLKEFNPQVIGIRSLTFYKDFFHKTAAMIRQWGFDVPVIAGGPYATSDYAAILQDRNIDLVILGEGEITFGEVIGKIIENTGTLPDEAVLRDIAGLAFIPRQGGMEGMEKEKKCSREIIMVDDLTGILSGESGGNLEPVNQPTDLAYVIFTSGSTGKPKGVMIGHRSLNNLCRWHNTHYAVSTTDRACKYAGFGFDASVWEIFPYLLIGAALVIIPDEIKYDIFKLSGYFESKNITIAFLPTQLCEAFMEVENQSLRILLTGGDKLNKYKKNNYRLVNNYGPTENTVVTTAFPVESHRGGIPIGKPIHNVQVYILSKEGSQLLPLGVPGELCIGGNSLARGYLNSPGLTAERFLFVSYRSHWSHRTYSSKKIYKSGDLARWLPDGNIEFLGRVDKQVMIRGFRIEPGEIEKQLSMQQEIEQAVVIDREYGSGEKYLCAYLVAKKELAVSRLRESLAKTLPDYMIPSYFLRIDQIPMTVNGKVDRKALARIKPVGTANEYTPPRDPVEARVAAVWEKILGVERVSIDDNFFEIGGNSLAAIQVVSELIRDYDISITHVFQYQTAAKLAAALTVKKENLEAKIREMKNRVETAAITNRTDPLLNDLEEEYRAYLEKVNREKYKKLKTKQKYRHILLTGVTGYLGAHLTGELLKETKAKLYLLVRGNTKTAAVEYAKEKLAFYSGNDFFNAFNNRLEVVWGDLNEDNLGIAAGDYRKLCETVDAVVHAAANVKHFGVYEDFYEVNVKGSERLLELARTAKKKDFHYISTMGVCSGSRPGQEKKYTLYTEFTHDVGQVQDNVYIKSKFEAEKQVLAYRENGLDTSLYRMGNLVFHSETGIFQENIRENAFYANMKAYISLGIVPDSQGMGFEMTFIDSAARALVLLITSQTSKNETYHLQNKHRLNWKQMDLFLENEGIKVQVITPEQFFEYLLENLDNNAYSAELDRLMLYSGLFEPGRENPGISLAVSDRTHMILKKLGFQWPEVTDHHVEKMISYCKKVGFLPGIDGGKIQ